MLRSIRIAITVALFALVWNPLGGEAEACDCMDLTAKEMVDGATQIFLVRAGEQITSTMTEEHPDGSFSMRMGPSEQAFEVLHVLKGKPPQPFVVRNETGVFTNCDTRFQKGDVGILFVRGADALNWCFGTGHLKHQLYHLPEDLRLTATGAQHPSKDVFTALVASGKLAGYLHDRPEIPIVFEKLSGGTVKHGKTTLPLVKSSKSKEVIVVEQAASNGPLHYIAIRFEAEGVVAKTVLFKHDGKVELLVDELVEQ